MQTRCVTAGYFVMPSILFIAPHRKGRSPSQRFRFEQYIPHLEENGYQCTFSPLLDAQDDAVFYQAGHFPQKLQVLFRSMRRRQLDIQNATNFDIIFVQREAFMLGTTYFESRLKKRAKLVFDFDDAIWLPNVSEANRRLAWLKRPQKTRRIIALADLVIAGNAYLADYAQLVNPNVVVIPTTIDTDLYTPRPPHTNDNPICIGWSGSISTIQHFKLAEPFLEIIKKKYGNRVKIKVIGDKNYKNSNLEAESFDWKESEELAHLRSFDIGIMPLPQDEWAKGKCGLKGLQYMAVGVPTVMAPVGVNSEIIHHNEDGFLANTISDWVNILSELIESPELREKIGKAGRNTVESRYSVRSQQDRYLYFLNRLLV